MKPRTRSWGLCQVSACEREGAKERGSAGGRVGPLSLARNMEIAGESTRLWPSSRCWMPYPHAHDLLAHSVVRSVVRTVV